MPILIILYLICRHDYLLVNTSTVLWRDDPPTTLHWVVTLSLHRCHRRCRCHRRHCHRCCTLHHRHHRRLRLPSRRRHRCCHRVTKIGYFSTYIWYLPTNPTPRHCDNIPASLSWIIDISRYHFRISNSSSTVELVCFVRILFDDTSQKL